MLLKYYYSDQIKELKWARHIACMEEMGNAYSILVGKPEGKRHLQDLGIDGRVILEWILGKQFEKVWSRIMWLRIGPSDGLL
jgi:hypothetical protein